MNQCSFWHEKRIRTVQRFLVPEIINMTTWVTKTRSKRGGTNSSQRDFTRRQKWRTGVSAGPEGVKSWCPPPACRRSYSFLYLQTKPENYQERHLADRSSDPFSCSFFLHHETAVSCCICFVQTLFSIVSHTFDRIIDLSMLSHTVQSFDTDSLESRSSCVHFSFRTLFTHSGESSILQKNNYATFRQTVIKSLKIN